jgi:hypothetical protein
MSPSLPHEPSALLLVVLLVFGIAAATVLLVTKFRDKKSRYRAIPFLSAAEILFFCELRKICEDSVLICPKVRLADLVHPAAGLNNQDRQSTRNRISQKHVDFVLVHPESFQVIGVIELDDGSHLEPKRQARDQMVDEALREASICICHVRAARAYNLEDLRKTLTTALAFDPGSQS